MCIAILNRGRKLTLEEFENCYKSNPHGIGQAYFQGGVLKIDKTVDEKNFSEFYFEKYLPAWKSRESDLLLHFRISTGGKIDLKNCHPFVLKNNFAMIHNGILPYSVFPCSAHESDTANLARFLNKLKLPITTPDVLRFVKKAAGGGKILILGKNRTYNLHEKRGIWDDGNWFSNSSYKSPLFLKRNLYDDDDIFYEKEPIWLSDEKSGEKDDALRYYGNINGKKTKY